MAEIRIVTEAELRGLLSLDQEVIACVEQAFAALAGGQVVMPPILRLDIEAYNGEVDVKTAYVPGLDSFAIKISPGFFDNPTLGLPSVNGLMVLFSARTGMVEALLLDNGFLTDLRTAAAGAVAAKHLARPDARTAAIIGCGVQARLQLQALTVVRPIESARIWGRRPEAAEAAAGALSESLGIPVTPAAGVEEAMSGTDIVVTTTPSTKPLVQGEWLNLGQHITAMGSDAEHKNELAPSCVVTADLYVADSVAQTRRLGELHHAIEAGFSNPEYPHTTLGRIVAGTAPGRTSAEQITLCDLTGTGVQDTAIATLARQRAEAVGAGSPFNS